MLILALSGSLRASSLNTATLRALSRLAPAHVEVKLYEGLAALPHFNPDVEAGQVPDSVLELRDLVGRSDGLVIASPEYAHGVPGAMKNALDWLVSSLEFPGKPVALINTASRATVAQAALREILETMSARLVPAASITLAFDGRELDADGIVGDAMLSSQLAGALGALAREIAG